MESLWEGDMERARWLKEAVQAGGEFHAMKADPFKHNLINLTALAVWIGLGVALASLGDVLTWWLYLPLAIVGFGSLYFGNFILVVHECSHNMFVLSRDRERQRSLNRLIGQIASAPFFTDYLQHWEKGHTTHHLRPCEPDDPQDKDPITGPTLFKQLAKLVFIPGYFAVVNPSNQYGFSVKRFGLGVLGLGSMIAVGTLLGGWAAGVAMLLGMETLSVLNLCKKAQEHGCGLKDEPDPLMRSRTYFYALAPIGSPFNINYHWEHHANFNVPWYLLPAYHRRLREIVPKEVWPWMFHHRYWEQMRGDFPRLPDELRPMLVSG